MTLTVQVAKKQGDFSLEVQLTAGRGVTAVFGRSGAGKSTLIKAIAGLVRPDSGRIKLNDHVLYDGAGRVFVPAHKRRVGLVFQDARLFPHLSVLQNLLYGARFSPNGMSKEDAIEMSGLLGLGDLLQRKPGSLSGGEAQRVAIGRALLSRPKLLLMDEPLAGLDQARKADVLTLVEKVRDVVGVPIVYVTHAREEVRRLASQVVVLGDGRVVDAGQPNSVLGLDQAGSLARTVQARLTVKNSTDGLSELSLSGGKLLVPQVDAPLGWVINVEIAARDIMLSMDEPRGLSALNALPCEVVSIDQSAGNAAAMDVRLACGEDVLIAQVTRRSVLQMGLLPGQPIHAVIKSVALAQTSGSMDKVDV